MTTPLQTQALTPPRAGTAETSAPSGEDYTLLLDLRDRIEDYLHSAVTAWLERSGLPCKGGARVDDYDSDIITACYYPMPEDAYRDDATFVTIPIADILPEYAAHRAVLTALHG